MNYVDSYVIAVPTAKREAYRQLAQDASAALRSCRCSQAHQLAGRAVATAVL
ncbi:DUF1428 family protein [Roseateles sp. P5_E7]